MMLGRWLRNLVLIALAPAMVVLILMHSGERKRAADAGLEAAQASHLLDQDVGSSLHMGLVLVGWIRTGADGGTADLSIPVHGSRGRGSLYLWARRQRDDWHVCSLDYRPYLRSSFRTCRGPLKILVSDQTADCLRK
jgi:hypothetical protein